MKKILLIEDDLEVSFIVEFVLREAGYAVILINREILYTEIAAINPNLVILDYLLPYALGDELCKTLKSRPDTKHIPVLLYSASNFGPAVARECKADGFMPKPFDIDQLLGAVKKLAV